MRSVTFPLRAKVGLLAVLALAALWVLSFDPVLMAGIRSTLASPPSSSAPDLAALKMAEPPVGFALPASKPLRKVQALVGQNQKGCLLVVLGTCGSCYRFDAAEWKGLADKHKLAIIAGGDFAERRAQEYAKEAHGRETMPTVADPRAEISGALTATYGGRVYLFDTAWHLRWRTELGTEQTPDDRNPERFDEWMEARP